jgi:hypothetical protein
MRTYLTLLATIAFFVAPSVTPPFMGYDPGMFPVEITRPSIQPAGYAFAIWGMIYTWLAVSAVFGLWRRGDAMWDRTRLPHLGALVLGTAWLAIANGFPITATIAIIAMAAFSLTAFLTASPTTDRWWLQAPLSMFAGWLTAASMVSLGVILSGYGWLSDTTTALAMLTVVVVVALTVQSRRPTMPLYGAAVIWASVGVSVVNWQANPTVAYAAVGGAVLLTLAVAGLFLRRAA